MTAQTHTLQAAGEPELAPVELSVTYRQSDGELRAVEVAVDANNLWTVYDIPAKGTGGGGIVVEHLTGPEERLGAALGVLIAYVEDQVAFHNGQRKQHSPESPLPREPQKADLARVRRDAKRAVKAVEADRERGSDAKNTEWLQRVMALAERQRAPIRAEAAERQPLAA